MGEWVTRQECPRTRKPGRLRHVARRQWSGRGLQVLAQFGGARAGSRRRSSHRVLQLWVIPQRSVPKSCCQSRTFRVRYAADRIARDAPALQPSVYSLLPAERAVLFPPDETARELERGFSAAFWAV